MERFQYNKGDKMRDEDTIKTFELPFTRCFENLEINNRYLAGYTRVIMRHISEKIEEFGLTYLFQDYDRFSLVGKTRAMKKFLKWYRIEILKYRGLRLL